MMNKITYEKITIGIIMLIKGYKRERERFTKNGSPDALRCATRRDDWAFGAYQAWRAITSEANEEKEVFYLKKLVGIA